MGIVNAETLAHVKRWEGLRLEAYPGPGSKDGEPWTIGYGHTSDEFLKVRKGLKITQEQADAALAWDLGEVADAIARLVKVPLTENQVGALASFAFNVGIGAFSKSTLLRKLNAGDYGAVPGELAKWVKNDGKTMQGLVNRRAAEAGLWAKGAPVASRTVKADVASLREQVVKPEVLAAAGGVLTGGAGLATGSGPVQWALGAVLVIAALVVAWVVVRKAQG